MAKRKILERGFTLLEVLVAVAVLSLATLYITQSNLTSMRVYSKYTNRLNLQNWADEKAWDAKQKILEAEKPETGESSGQIEGFERPYLWRLQIDSTDLKEVYTYRLQISWKEGRDTAQLIRAGFAQKPKAE